MRITFKQLQIFVAIAKTKQVSLAAEKCFISQSAASMALNQFEKSLNLTLFERLGKRLVLNDLGKTLLPKAIEILDRITEFEQTTSAANHRGELTILASKTTGVYLVPDIIRRFKTTYPNVKLNYKIENSKRIVKEILNSTADIGFIESDYKDKRIEQLTLKKDKLAIVASKNHPLTTKKNIALDDLFDYPWILREQGSGTRKIFEQAASKVLHKLNIEIEINEPEVIKKLLHQSNYLSCLSESMVATEVESKKLSIIKLNNFDLTRDFNMIHLASRYQTPLLKKFYAIAEIYNKEF